jgi:hypothetical protein
VSRESYRRIHRLLFGGLLVLPLFTNIFCTACSGSLDSNPPLPSAIEFDLLTQSQGTQNVQATRRAEEFYLGMTATLKMKQPTLNARHTDAAATRTAIAMWTESNALTSTPGATCGDPKISILDYEEVIAANYWFGNEFYQQKDEVLSRRYCPVSCAKRVWLTENQSLTLLLIQNKSSSAAVKSVESTWRIYENTRPNKIEIYDPYDGTFDGRFLVQFEYVDFAEDAHRIVTVLARAIDDIFLMIVQIDKFQYSLTIGYILHRGDILLSLHALECVQLKKLCGITECRVYY